MFIVFPLNGKPDWRRPPIVTLLIIVVNCLVFFGPQRADQQRHDKAAAYYTQSALPGIELPMYLRELQRRAGRDDAARADFVRDALAAEAWLAALSVMESDEAFLRQLRSGRIVTDEHPRRAAWQSQRARYDEVRGERFTERWMSTPAHWRPETAITSVFLHGNTAHLAGNMVFLFAFGYTVELALGGGWFLLFYLLAGIGGDLGDLIARWGSPVGSLGASGAVAGLMAMYAALHGTRRIHFFYLLAFYFNHVRAPAIILLPAWLASELLQFWLRPDSGIAYMAHAGGLLAGALMAFAYKRFRPDVKVPTAPVSAADALAADLGRARLLLSQLKIEPARALLAELAARHPQDPEVIRQYCALSRLAPDSLDFHRSSALALALAGQDEATIEFVRERFNDYLTLAQPRPRLTAAQLARLGRRFARANCLAEAVRVEAMLARFDPGSAELADVRLALVAALMRARRRDEAASYAAAVRHCAPDSSEAKLAAELLAS